ncbi:MAG: M23 family metallopeptidase [Armatimonadota bacterium]|nr:M23 family metallopeptidase [Armatimonadota bacterium]
MVPSTGSSTRAVARAAARRESTVTHVVRSGETLWDIARRYGTDIEDLMALNNLGHSDWIKPGQRLHVSAGTLPRHRRAGLQTRSGTGLTTAEARRLRASGAFLWPARGTLTSRFGWRRRRQHEGIDIAARAGTPVYAARDGVVEVAGWHYGYGKAVLLRHEGGMVTVYGHASVLHVRVGQRVKKGQLIARVGCTGWCTGPHLHFEVRRDGRAVDPMPYLR